MRFSPIVRYALAALLAGAIVYSPAARALVISGSSLAFGESVSTTGALVLSSGPMPMASGVAPPPYSVSTSGIGAGVVPLLSTLALTVNASSNVDGLAGARFASADATVNSVTMLTLAGFFFSAASVSSTALVSGDFGALAATGTTTLVDALLTVGGVPVALDAAPAPNTVISLLGGTVEIRFNEQILGGDGVGSRSLEVNAIHFLFNDLLIPQVGTIDGDLILSHSEAALAAIPEPATLLLIAGGLLALGCRRSQAFRAACIASHTRAEV